MLLAGSAQIEAVLAVGHPERAEDLEPHPMIASCFRDYAWRARRWAVVWIDPGSSGVMIEGGFERRLEMLRRIPIAFVVVALVTLLAAPGAYAGRGGMDRPFRATMVGEASWDVRETPIPGCGLVTTLTHGTGRATHMGRIETSWAHCPLSDSPLPDGRLTIVAANGDELDGTYDYPDVDGIIPITISGGTGRFGDASGEVEASINITPQFSDECTTPELSEILCVGDPPYVDITVPWPWSAKLTGTITY